MDCLNQALVTSVVSHCLLHCGNVHQRCLLWSYYYHSPLKRKAISLL